MILLKDFHKLQARPTFRFFVPKKEMTQFNVAQFHTDIRSELDKYVIYFAEIPGLIQSFHKSKRRKYFRLPFCSFFLSICNISTISDRQTVSRC